MQFKIDSTLDGIAVKDFLYNTLSFSSNMVKRLKALANGISVNGSQVTVRYVLRTGDVLVLQTEDFDNSESIEPVKLPLDIIYEDDYVIAINKPAGMPTHPSHNHRLDTLANALAYYYSEAHRPFVFRAINRLDADTSGIVLIAKDKNSAFKLARFMAEGKIHKKYAALLHGTVTKSGEIELPIRRSSTSTMLRVVDQCPDSGAKYALTKYEVLHNFDGYTLVSASPVTGRTHQLRVHFSTLGNPICGDGLYGITSDGSDFPRLALHAYIMSFPHQSGNILTLVAPIPDNTDPRFCGDVIKHIIERSHDDKQ